LNEGHHIHVEDRGEHVKALSVKRTGLRFVNVSVVVIPADSVKSSQYNYLELSGVDRDAVQPLSDSTANENYSFFNSEARAV